jgi:hypothetical protein
MPVVRALRQIRVLVLSQSAAEMLTTTSHTIGVAVSPGLGGQHSSGETTRSFLPFCSAQARIFQSRPLDNLSSLLTITPSYWCILTGSFSHGPRFGRSNGLARPEILSAAAAMTSWPSTLGPDGAVRRTESERGRCAQLGGRLPGGQGVAWNEPVPVLWSVLFV